LEPARLIELVRAPGCAPSLGGVRLPLGQFRQQGGHGTGTSTRVTGLYHAHYYAFPLLVMLDLFMDAGTATVTAYLDF